MTSGRSRIGRHGLRRVFGVLFAGLLALVAVAPASAYNGENKLHVRLNQPQHTECGDPAPLTATVTDRTGDPQEGVMVSFIKHHGYAGETLTPASDPTDANGKAESSYTIPCGSRLGARVVKACEPAGGCATTVVVCRQKDGCTETGNAGGGLIVPVTPSRDSATATVPSEPLSGTTSATLPPLLNVLSFALLGLLAAGFIRGRPKAFRPATPA